MNITAQYGSYALNERRNHTRLGNSHPFLGLSRKSARTAQIEMLPPVAWPQLPPRTVGPAVPTELTGAGCGPQAAALLAFQPICLTSVKDHTQVSLHLCCLILPSRPPNNKSPFCRRGKCCGTVQCFLSPSESMFSTQWCRSPSEESKSSFEEVQERHRLPTYLPVWCHLNISLY